MFENPPVALMLVPLPVVVGGVIGFVVGIVTGSVLWGLLAFVVAAAAIAAAAFLAADWLALKLLAARPLAEGGSTMLRNQLEELSARTGVTEPSLYTVGAGAPAIASVGRTNRALVVTDGLTDELSVVELEAAVAREIARMQSGATTVDTLAVPFLTLPLLPMRGLARRALAFFRGSDHDARTDLDGVGITRYPPGMTAALQKMKGGRPGGSFAVEHLWATGVERPAGKPGSFSLDDRLEMLREL